MKENNQNFMPNEVFVLQFYVFTVTMDPTMVQSSTIYSMRWIGKHSLHTIKKE